MFTNTSELSRYLRFRLSQLSAENAHHRFEELARQFARTQICERILPATGPVGAGGDQGLDFESYKTYIKSSPLVGSSFIGISDQRRIGFAVSLEKKIVPKIHRDIKAICESPVKFDSIYYFCETDVAVAKRHRAQEWAKKEFQIELEIFDGQALAELLANHSVFWIAMEFLGVPANLFPADTTSDDSYNQMKKKWLIDTNDVYNLADFSQIKSGLRKATFSETLRPDLSEWIQRMQEFRSDLFTRSIQRKAAYEICVAALRGQNNLTYYLSLLRDYLVDFAQQEDLSDLEDLVNLLVYCSTARVLGHLDIELNEIEKWIDDAIEFTQICLSRFTWHEARARIFEVRGMLSLTEQTLERQASSSAPFEWWERVLDEAEYAKLFPIETFADILTQIAEFEADNPLYRELAARTDKLIVKNTGGYVAAEKCRDRALAMIKNQNYVAAIIQLHDAKANWFSAGTLRGSLLCMEMLGDCYMKIGLLYAAKYYWSGMINLALQQDKMKYSTSIVRTMARLASASYVGGEWLEFVQMAEAAIKAEEALLDQEDEYDHLESVFGNIVLLRSIMHLHSSGLDKDIEDLLTKALGGPENYDTWLPNASEDRKTTERIDPDENWIQLEQQLYNRPFCDVDGMRTIVWKSSGIRWHFEFENDFSHTICAESIISFLQIAIADLAHVDLVLLPLDVNIALHVVEEKAHTVDRLPENSRASWKVKIPLEYIQNPEREQNLKNLAVNMLVDILSECSLLKLKTLEKALKQSFESNLIQKAFFLGPYSSTFRARWNEESFSSLHRLKLQPLCKEREFNSSCTKILKWNDSEGPGYSHEKAVSFLEKRYSIPLKSMKLSLPILMKQDSFRLILCKLRREGLLDWEILVIVSAIMANERAESLFPDYDDYEVRGRKIKDLMYEEETAGLPAADADWFSYDRCQLQYKFAQVSVAKTWKLEVRQSTPAFNALKQLLDVRYHQRTDDIEHENFLVC